MKLYYRLVRLNVYGPQNTRTYNGIFFNILLNWKWRSNMPHKAQGTEKKNVWINLRVKLSSP